MTQPNATRLLLVGQPGSEFRLAAEMARDAGAHVDMADAPAQALALLRSDGAMMVMIDVGLDAAGFIAQLRAERFTLPVIACGINASADQAVSAIRAGARDYVPLPPERSLIAAAIASIAPTASSVILGEDPALARAVSFGLQHQCQAQYAVRACAIDDRHPDLLQRNEMQGRPTPARATAAARGKRVGRRNGRGKRGHSSNRQDTHHAVSPEVAAPISGTKRHPSIIEETCAPEAMLSHDQKPERIRVVSSGTRAPARRHDDAPAVIEGVVGTRSLDPGAGVHAVAPSAKRRSSVMLGLLFILGCAAGGIGLTVSRLI